MDHSIETLRKQHGREHIPPLDLHPSLTQDTSVQDNTTWFKLISAYAIHKHICKQQNDKAPDQLNMCLEILKCQFDGLPPDIRLP